MSLVQCPFCADEGFDLPGLTYHLTYCGAYVNAQAAFSKDMNDRAEARARRLKEKK